MSLLLRYHYKTEPTPEPKVETPEPTPEPTETAQYAAVEKKQKPSKNAKE